MNENVIDTLKIKIVGDSSNAVDSLDKLISTIDRIKNATSGGNKGLSGIDKHLSKISAACDKINAGALSKIYKLADGLRTLNDIGNIKISSKFADRILDLGAAVELLQGLDMSKLTEMADGLKALNNVGQVKIPKPDVSTPASTPEAPSASNLSGVETMQSEVVKATDAVGGLRNALSSTLSLFSNIKNNISGVASTIKTTIADSMPWKVMSNSVRDVASAVGTLAVGMGKIGSISLSFAKHIASDIVKPTKMAIGAVKGLVGKVGNLFRLFKKRAMYRVMNMVISSITKGFSEGTKHVYEYSKAVGTALAPSLDKLATSGLYLKNSLGAMVAPLINMIAPAIDKLVDKFVELLNIANQAFAAMSGATTWTKAIKYPTQYADATKKAAKANDKLKKSILGFDEINPLQDNSKNSGNSGKEGEDYSLMFEEKPIKSFAKDIENILGGIFKPFKDAWDKEGSKTIQSIQDRFSAMKTFLGTIGDTFRQVWTNGTGETILSNMLQIIQSINQISTNLYTNLTKAWNANDNGLKITQNVSDAFISLQNVVKGFFDSTAKWIGKLDFTPAMTSISKLTDKFKPFIDLVGGALLDAYNDVLLPIGSWVIEDAGPAAIDTLAAAFDALNALLKPVKDGLNAIWDAIKPFIQWIEDTAMVVIDGFKSVFSKLAEVFRSKGDTIKGIFTGIGDALKGAWNIIQPIFEMLKDLVKTTFDFITEFIGNNLGDVIDAFKGVVDFFAGVFTGDWSRAWDGIKKIFTGVWNVIKDIAGVVVDTIKKPFELAWNGIKAAWNGAKTFFSNIWSGIKSVFSGVAGWFIDRFRNAWKGIKAIWNGVKTFFSNIWSGIKSVFSGVAGWFKDRFRNAWNGIKAIWNGVKTFFSNIWTGITNIFKGVATWFKDRFRNAWEGIKGIWNGVKTFFRNIWTGITNIFKNVATWFGDRFRAAWNGIKNIWNGVKGFFKKIWSGITDVFKGVATWFGDRFRAAWKGIKDIFSGVGKFFGDLWDLIKKPFVKIASWFGDKFSKAWDGITNVFTGVGKWFSDLWDKIKQPFIKVATWFEGIFSDAWRLIKDVFKGIGSWFSDRWDDIKKPFIYVGTWFQDKFEDAKRKIKEVWDKIKEIILGVWESIKWVFESLTGASDTEIKKKARAELAKQGKTYTDAEWEKAWKTQKFASGGLVNEGQMFIAREAGPELVGTIGNRTAVMNNDQIVESVAMGVADANAEQNALLREEISILRKILAKDYGSGSGGYGDILSELNRRNRRNGKTLVSIGI